jgi:hypothetical protein
MFPGCSPLSTSYLPKKKKKKTPLRNLHTALAFSPPRLSLASPANFYSYSLILPFLLIDLVIIAHRPTPSVLMKMRRHSYTHQEQKLHAFPCRI